MDQFVKTLEVDQLKAAYEYLPSSGATFDMRAVLFTGVYAICTISGSSNDFPSFLKIPSPITVVRVVLDSSSENTSVMDDRLLSGINFGCNGFVVQQEMVIDFLNIYTQIHDEATYRNPQKYLLVVMDQSSGIDVLEDLRNHANLEEVVNLLIMQPSHELEAIDLITHHYVGFGNYPSELYLVDRFDVEKKELLIGVELFPDKTTNLQGRPIRVAAFNVIPHIILRENEPIGPRRIGTEDKSYDLDGLNGLLLVEFCKRHNCTIELVVDATNMWGVINENRTGNGILGNLVERRADVGIGALSGWYYCLQYLTFSTPIQQGSITCLVPKPPLYPRWKIISLAFSTTVYLVIGATFCTLVILFHLANHFSAKRPEVRKDIAWSVINVTAIFLLQSVNIRDRNPPKIILTLSLLLFALNMGSIYSGRNASLRTITLYKPSIDTIYDLAESGISWLQTHEAWAFSLMLSDNPTVKKLISNFKALPSAELRRTADQGQSAFAMARLHNEHLMIGDWITPENVNKYQLMRDDLYYSYDFAMATKTWPLMERFNELLLHSFESLLLRYQELRVIYENSDYRVQTAIINSRMREKTEPEALELEDFLGAFLVLGLGLGAGMISYLWENF